MGLIAREPAARASTPRRLRFALGVKTAVAAALGLATMAAYEDVVATVHTVATTHVSAETSRHQLERAFRLDPSVFDAVAAVVPKRSTYELIIAKRLAPTVRGQAFEALMQERLLPRIRRPHATWVVSWTSDRLHNCCHRAVRVGSAVPGDPLVFVYYRG